MPRGTRLDREHDSYVSSPSRGSRYTAQEVVSSYSQAALNPFNELEVVQRRTIFDMKGGTPSLSTLRNNVSTTGSATVVKSGPEILISTTSSGTDSATVKTAEFGRYQPGSMSEAGIGVRLGGETYQGSQYSQWGYFQSSDGFYFGVDASGIYVGTRRAGSDVKVRQEDWNVDRLDGTGESGLTLDLTKGNIFTVKFAWYGYGVAQFCVDITDSSIPGGQKRVLVHTFQTENETSLSQPNLPIAAEVNNNGATNALTLYIGGRHYSIHGSHEPIRRVTGEFSGIKTLPASGFIPLISFRKKAGVDNQGQSAKVGSIEIITDTNTIYGIVTNATLTGASWGDPNGHDPTETVMESDTSATAFADGINIGPYNLVAATTKTGISLGATNLFDFEFLGEQPVTLIAKAVSTAGEIKASTFNVIEEW